MNKIFNPRQPIVLVSAKQGAGRRTLCRELRELFAKEGVICGSIQFADPLHTMHDHLMDVLQNECHVDVPVKDGPLLQMLGHEWLRTYYGSNVLVRTAERRAAAFQEENANAMFPSLLTIEDARYPDEFDAFPHALRVRLECDREVRRHRARHWRQTEYHPSEVGLDSYASMGKFDLLIDTGFHDIKTSAALVWERLKQSISEGRILGRTDDRTTPRSKV